MSQDLTIRLNDGLDLLRAIAMAETSASVVSDPACLWYIDIADAKMQACLRPPQPHPFRTSHLMSTYGIHFSYDCLIYILKPSPPKRGLVLQRKMVKSLASRGFDCAAEYDGDAFLLVRDRKIRQCIDKALLEESDQYSNFLKRLANWFIGDSDDYPAEWR